MPASGRHGGKRNNAKRRDDDARGGARRGAGPTPDLAAGIRLQRTRLAHHGHKLNAAEIAAARDEAGALLAELQRADNEMATDWSGEIL